MKKIQQELRNAIYEAIKDKYTIEPDEITFSIPPKREYGDLSTTIPFVVAKRSGKKPHELGKELTEALKDSVDLVSAVSVQGGGFLNFFLDRDAFFGYLGIRREERPEKKIRKIIVEHTSINPNKSAHIGHLRNACIGDVLSRGLRFLGYEVEVQNYLDDTGIQVADVVWGLLKHEGKDIDEIKKIENLAFYLWEKYPEYSSFLKEDEESRKQRDMVHKQMEEKIDPFYQAGEYISGNVVLNHIDVMDSMDIRYDVLIRERDIIELDFFKDASKVLVDSGIMYDSKDPEKKGCKVIKYRKEDIEKIVVRSNGTITYIGKDIAYALWKVGLLKRDFYFQEFYRYGDGKRLFISSFSPEGEKKPFGNAERIFTVIDVRQSYLQNIISGEVINRLGSDDNGSYVHFSYEMVALTPACVQDLGFELSQEEKKRSYIEVSGRKGIAVSADDLLNKLYEKSDEEIRKRNPDLKESEIRDIADKIAKGALRYFMIRFNSNTVISFDFNNALSFEGDTGPYLQYTLVRINSILKKVSEKELIFEKNGAGLSLLNKDEIDLIFEMLLKLSMVEMDVEMSIEKRELSFISSHTYIICQLFNQYYHKFPVVSENNADIRRIRINFLLLVRSKLSELFGILGIPVPRKM